MKNDPSDIYGVDGLDFDPWPYDGPEHEPVVRLDIVDCSITDCNTCERCVAEWDPCEECTGDECERDGGTCSYK